MSAGWSWFRMWTDARTDSKLDALTDREFRIWLKLLCLASEKDPRGEVDLVDIEFVAMELRVGADELDSAISRMVRLRLVERSDAKVTFPAFAGRQYVKPSDMPEATRARKQSSRTRRAGGSTQSRHVTPLSRHVTPAVTPTEQSRAETEGEWGNNTGAVENPVPLSELLAAARQHLNGGGR